MQTIEYLHWKTKEPKIYTLLPKDSSLDLYCPLDHTPLVLSKLDWRQEPFDYIHCPNCGENYSNSENLTQKGINNLFQSKLKDYKKKVQTIQQEEKDLTLRILKAEEGLISSSSSKCKIDCRSCKGITCEKSC